MNIGPNIRENNLLFYYDVGNIKSYVGEPTTNLIPTPTINALPTYNNGWGTYNTNQYCGNNGCGAYWDLATVSSISSNIVTTATAHGLRTFDVINPQTTGGGVTSGTQYFVKAISTTQFTLHAYNGSQDGSQGYVNTATGGFKVHDSIWLDQRISVSSSGFPVKWFGNAHQPNSGLVKEIIPNGYRNLDLKYSDCIRLHIPRPTGVDGMSYGVDTPVTPGLVYTTSFWVKPVTPSAVGRGVYFQHYNYGGDAGATVYDMSFTLGEIGVWKRISFSYTPAHTTLISYWFPNGDYVYDFDLANIQIEQKSHPTNFITGTRSSTNILKNIASGTPSYATLPNMSYDSSNMLTFDGVDDYLTIPSNNYDFSNGLTAEFVANFTNYGSWQRLFDFGNGPSSDNILFTRYGGSDTLRFEVYKGSVTTVINCASCIITNKLVHYAVTINGSTAVIYVNGVAAASSSFTALPNTVTRANNYVGKSNWADAYFQGQIPMIKFYNIGLSETEIKQNYNTIKNRFNL